MIKKEPYRVRKDGVKVLRVFSDREVQIRKVGTNYVDNEAFDVESASFQYEETDEPCTVEGG